MRQYLDLLAHILDTGVPQGGSGLEASQIQKGRLAGQAVAIETFSDPVSCASKSDPGRQGA